MQVLIRRAGYVNPVELNGLSEPDRALCHKLLFLLGLEKKRQRKKSEKRRKKSVRSRVADEKRGIMILVRCSYH